MKIPPSKTPRCRKLSYFSEFQNDALMHCEGLEGYAWTRSIQMRYFNARYYFNEI